MSRRCTAATWPRWSRPTTPRDPWWSTCAYRSSRLEVSKRKPVCVSVWVTSYIMLTKKMCESIVSCNVEQKTRKHQQDSVQMGREIPEGVWLKQESTGYKQLPEMNKSMHVCLKDVSMCGLSRTLVRTDCNEFIYHLRSSVWGLVQDIRLQWADWRCQTGLWQRWEPFFFSKGAILYGSVK